MPMFFPIILAFRVFPAPLHCQQLAGEQLSSQYICQILPSLHIDSIGHCTDSVVAKFCTTKIPHWGRTLMLTIWVNTKMSIAQWEVWSQSVLLIDFVTGLTVSTWRYCSFLVCCFVFPLCNSLCPKRSVFVCAFQHSDWRPLHKGVIWQRQALFGGSS